MYSLQNMANLQDYYSKNSMCAHFYCGNVLWSNNYYCFLAFVYFNPWHRSSIFFFKLATGNKYEILYKIICPYSFHTPTKNVVKI